MAIEKKRSFFWGDGLESFLIKHEKLLIGLLVFFATIRVLFFCAAFPFFNSSDELYHFDIVVKYSHGYLPSKGSDRLAYESADLIWRYQSPEYLMNHKQLAAGLIQPPVWTWPADLAEPYISEGIKLGLRKINHDAFAPPVYYAIAGLWYNLGKFFGREGGGLLYWTRFLNAGIYAALMFFSFFMCKKIQGQNRLLPLGVVLLLAFFPQDIFYSINSDVLSPLLFTVSLFLMAQLYSTERRVSFYILTGAMVALTFLTKLSNLPVLIIFVIFVSSLVKRFYTAKKIPAYHLHLFALVAAAFLPIAAWMGSNYFALGDITGTASKIRLLGWTTKSLAEIFDHPVFTPQGLSLFLTDLTKTFWRGETLWGMKPLAAGNTDYFFVLSSFVFLAAAVTGRFKNKQVIGAGLFLRFADLLIIFLFIAYLLALSITYDFGDCFYPSRGYPFFTSGRLILGALVPFLILYFEGLEQIAKYVTKRLSPIIIVLFIVIIFVRHELLIASVIVKSQFNWFHM